MTTYFGGYFFQEGLTEDPPQGGDGESMPLPSRDKRDGEWYGPESTHPDLGEVPLPPHPEEN